MAELSVSKKSIKDLLNSKKADFLIPLNPPKNPKNTVAKKYKNCPCVAIT